MNCGDCKHSYNNDIKCPRLLIKCGHSLCEQCMEIRFSKGCIICPECKATNYAEFYKDFPRNLAILNFNNTKTDVEVDKPQDNPKNPNKEKPYQKSPIS